MKIAILISGQPRFMQQGSKWIIEKVFPRSKGYKVDFFVHLWDNGDPELEKKIIDCYSPVDYKISNYEQYIQEFKSEITDRNRSLPENIRNLVPRYVRENILFDTPEPTKYGENFWGQFLSTHEVSELFEDYEGYDMVIKTRSDAVMDPVNPETLYRALNNIRRNPNFKNKIFTPWLQAVGGIPYFCDFAFIATPETWKLYSENLREKCLRLATTDNALFYEFNIHEFSGISHWVWNKLSIYTFSGFLSFTVTWPMNFNGVALIRKDIDISNMEHRQINQMFLENQ